MKKNQLWFQTFILSQIHRSWRKCFGGNHERWHVELELKASESRKQLEHNSLQTDARLNTHIPKVEEWKMNAEVKHYSVIGAKLCEAHFYVSLFSLLILCKHTDNQLIMKEANPFPQTKDAFYKMKAHADSNVSS